MESGISSMGNSGSSNRDAPTPLSLTSAVDSAIRSSTALNLGASRVHTFASRVDNAIKSSSGGEDLETSHSPVHGFASRVDNAIKSSIGGEDLETPHSPVHGFASASGEDKAMRSISGNLRTSHSPVHGFQLFTLDELEAATNNFSLDNKIGAGSFGCVYSGKLVDGREVDIKRGRTWSKRRSEEKDERLLVYEYMKNGAWYDHLHDKGSSVHLLNSWKMRIKIALDASRGIQYIHNYAVPYIHRDIKSSNILLDATWTARVSDFGLPLMSPEPDRDNRPLKAAGSVGYIDPDYYGLNVSTAKSDVYGHGVVLLELLTGKTAIFRQGEDGGTPLSVVVVVYDHGPSSIANS